MEIMIQVALEKPSQVINLSIRDTSLLLLNVWRFSWGLQCPSISNGCALPLLTESSLPCFVASSFLTWQRAVTASC